MRDVKKWMGAKIYDRISPRTHLPNGFPDKEIPALAEKIDADLIVMGTVARTGVPGLIIGNKAENILQQSKYSVLCVKPQGFVTPVSLED